MGVSAIIGAVGLAASAVGTVVSVQASQASAKAQKQALAAQQQAEDLRQQSMNFEAQRQQQQVLRQAQTARSVAISNAANSGSSLGSGLQGGESGINSTSDTRIGGIGTEQGLGNSIFAANANKTQAQIAGASAQSEAAIGGGITSLGGGLIHNQGQLTNIFNNFTSGNKTSGSTDD